jgi:tetratricopeptide (TPR) repeat protein
VNHDTGTVIKMCEELTRLEPFTDIYWTMLAQAYAEESQVEKALSAVDYALAINEKNKEAILLKAQLRLLNDDADDGLMAQMNELLAANPNDYNVLKTAAVLYQIADREDDLALLYTNFLNDEPGNWQVLESLLEIFPFRMYIERYYDSAPTHDENEWLAMAERLGHAGHHESASELLGVFNDREVLSIRGFEAYVVEMYMAKKYKEIIDKLEKPVVKVYDPYVTAVVSICYAYSLLRTSHEAKALKFIDEWFVRAENHLVPSPQMRLTETGVSTYFQELDSVVRNPTAKRTFDSIDPFRPMIPGSPAY